MANTKQTTKRTTKTKAPTFTRGAVNDDGLTRKYIVYRAWLNMPPEDRKPAAMVAFAESSNLGLSAASVKSWCGFFKAGQVPARSADVADPHAKPKRKRTTKK